MPVSTECAAALLSFRYPSPKYRLVFCATLGITCFTWMKMRNTVHSWVNSHAIDAFP